MQTKRIILVGFMGSGKTTVGHALARSMGWTYYDLDWYIETRRHTTIADIFRTEGEERFRTIEHNMLHEVAEFENVVIGCGGGTPCFYDNMAYMNRQGCTVYLKASPDVLLHHLSTARTPRPLWKVADKAEAKATLTRMLSEREPFYLQAQHIINIDHFDNRKDINTAITTLQNILLQHPKPAHHEEMDH